MKNLSINKVAGLAGLASAFLYILSIIGMQAYLASSLDDMDAFIQNIMDAHDLMLLYAWPGIVATLLIIPVIYVFSKMNKETRFASQVLTSVTLIGLAFIFVGYLFHLAFTYFHAPIYQGAATDARVAFGLLIESTIGIQDMFWLVGDLFAILGISFLLFLNVKEQFFPKWLLWMGIMASVSAALGSFNFIPAFKGTPGLGLLFIGGFSLFAIWEISVGTYLLKSRVPISNQKRTIPDKSGQESD